MNLDPLTCSGFSLINQRLGIPSSGFILIPSKIVISFLVTVRVRSDNLLGYYSVMWTHCYGRLEGLESW